QALRTLVGTVRDGCSAHCVHLCAQSRSPPRPPSPRRASLLGLLKWHVSCFLPGVPTEKGHINEQAKRPACAMLVTEEGAYPWRRPHVLMSTLASGARPSMSTL